MNGMSLEKGLISTRQAAFMITNTIMATTVLFIPALLARGVGHDAWITVAIIFILVLPFGYAVQFLGLRFPDQNLVEYSIELLGPWIGRGVALIFVVFFLYLSGVVVREFGVFLVTAVMPSTPEVVFNTLLVLLAAYGVYLGLEVIARVTELIFPISLAAGLVIFLMALPEMDFYQLQPVMAHSFPSILRTSMVLLAFITEGIVALMLIPNMNKKRQAALWLPPVVSLLLFFSLIIVVAGAIALMGGHETARLVFPVYEFAKTVHLGGFIERIESLMVGIWVTTVGLKLMVLFYGTVTALAETCNLKDYRPLVLPTGVLLVALSILIFPDAVAIRHFLAHTWPAMSLTVSLGILVLLWAVSLVRKKGNYRQGGEQNERDSRTKD
jgi:spore germination protein KB